MIGHPSVTLLLALVGTSVAGVYSIHYALGVLILWLVLLAFYVDRRLLSHVLIPPFAAVMMWEGLALGVGIPFLVYAWEGVYDRSLFIMQITHIVLFPVCYLAYRVGFRSVPRLTFPRDNPVFQSEVMRPLAVLGWILIGWRVIQITALAATGAEDRGESSASAQGQVWGVFTYFILFQRFNNLGFALLPVVFERARGLGRIALLALLAGYFSIALASGTRGNLIFPILYCGVGYFFFSRVRRTRLEVIALALGIIVFPLLSLVHRYRNTEAYQTTRTIDVVSRIKALKETSAEENAPDEDARRTNIGVVGSALIGVSDAVIYDKTPVPIPFAKWDNFSAIIYTWVPVYFKEDRPILYDSNDIVAAYLDYESKSGSAISLRADLYRRFGWTGLPVGTAIAWLVYAAFCAFAYRVYLYRNALAGLFLIVLTFSFFLGRPFGTVLTTWWVWAYELPKHLFVLIVLYFIVRLLTGARKVPGALAMESHVTSC